MSSMIIDHANAAHELGGSIGRPQTDNAGVGAGGMRPSAALAHAFSGTDLLHMQIAKLYREKKGRRGTAAGTLLTPVSCHDHNTTA